MPCWPKAQVNPLPAQAIVEDLPSDEDKDYLKHLNDSALPIKMIEDIAADHLRHPANLKKEQVRLLKIVEYSRESERHKVAASNAISILKETGFSFRDLSLKGISIPFADLSHAVLDDVDFTGADLTGVNFSNSSLQRTKFSGANFAQVNFGIDFILQHESEVAQMALFPDQKRLVSVDGAGSISSSSCYVWDLGTLRLIKKIPLSKPTPPQKRVDRLARDDSGSRIMYQPIIFSPDGKYFLLAYESENRGTIDIMETKSFNRVSRTMIFDNSNFNLCAVTANGHYILGYGNSIDIWEINNTIHAMPKLELKSQKDFDHLQCSAYHHGTNRLALYANNRFEIYSIPEVHPLTSFEIPPELREGISSLEFTSTGDALLFARKNHVYKWNMQQNQPELLFSEELIAPEEHSRNPLRIRSIKSLPQSSLIAYFSETARTYFQSAGTNFVIGQTSIRDIDNPGELVFQDDYSGYEFNNINMILHGKKIIRLVGTDIGKTPLETTAAANELRSIPEGYRVMNVSFTPDSKQVATLTREGTLHHFAVMTGKSTNKVRAITEHYYKERPELGEPSVEREQLLFREDKVDDDRSYSCTISPDGRYLVGEYLENAKKHLRISQLETGLVCHQLEQTYITHAVSEDNRYIIFLKENGLELWDIEKNVSLGTVPVPLSKDDFDHKIIISPNVYPSAHVVIAYLRPRSLDGTESKVELWKINWTKEKLNFPERVAEFQASSLPSSLKRSYVFAGDKLFYSQNTRGGHGFYQFDLLTEASNEISDYPIFRDGLLPRSSNFDVSKDGKYLVFLNVLTRRAFSEAQNGLILYDIQQAKQLDEFKTTLEMTNLCISPNGRFVASWNEKDILVWEIVDGHLQLLWQKPQNIGMKNAKVTNIKNLSPDNARFIEMAQKGNTYETFFESPKSAYRARIKERQITLV